MVNSELYSLKLSVIFSNLIEIGNLFKSKTCKIILYALINISTWWKNKFVLPLKIIATVRLIILGNTYILYIGSTWTLSIPHKITLNKFWFVCVNVGSVNSSTD